MVCYEQVCFEREPKRKAAPYSSNKVWICLQELLHWIFLFHCRLLTSSVNLCVASQWRTQKIFMGGNLFELYGAAFLFIWCGNGVPTPLYLALHPYTWPLQPIVFKWRQNSPSTGFASWSRIDTTWMRCATLDLVMLINGKFDIPCKLDILRHLSTCLSQLHWKASWSFAKQSCRHGAIWWA